MNDRSCEKMSLFNYTSGGKLVFEANNSVGEEELCGYFFECRATF